MNSAEKAIDLLVKIKVECRDLVDIWDNIPKALRSLLPKRFVNSIETLKELVERTE